MTEHSFLDKLFLSPSSSLACDISSFYLANRRVIISHWPLRALASAVNTHITTNASESDKYTYHRSTYYTPYSWCHSNKHLSVLCVDHGVSVHCSQLLYISLSPRRSSAALVFIACKHFKQMLRSCMQVQELLFSGKKKWKVCGKCLYIWNRVQTYF